MGRSSATQAHYATNITPLLSADSCSVLNTAILLPLPATADEQDCHVCPEQIPCQQTLKTNAGSAPQHRMEFVFILSPDLLEKIVCREAHKHLCRVNFHSARLALTWNPSTKYIQRILGRMWPCGSGWPHTHIAPASRGMHLLECNARFTMAPCACLEHDAEMPK